ncbi:MAG: hypothetical protein WCH01_14750, partial [Methylococcaceae bacterium]
ISVTKKIPIPADPQEAFYGSVAEDLLAFLVELDGKLPKILERANRGNAHDDYLEQKAFVVGYENGKVAPCLV